MINNISVVDVIFYLVTIISTAFLVSIIIVINLRVYLQNQIHRWHKDLQQETDLINNNFSAIAKNLEISCETIDVKTDYINAQFYQIQEKFKELLLIIDTKIFLEKEVVKLKNILARKKQK